MIRMWRLETALWMIEYNGVLRTISTRAFTETDQYKRRKNRMGLKHMKFAISKATNLYPSQFRHTNNTRINGVWITEWKVI